MKMRKILSVVLSAAVILGVGGAVSYEKDLSILSEEVSAADTVSTTTTETATTATTEAATTATTEAATTTTTEAATTTTTESSTTTTTESSTTTTTEASTTITTEESTTATTTAKIDQTITASNFIKLYKKNGTFYINASAKTKLTYSSSNTKVVKVNSKGKVTIKGTGTALITIRAEADETYSASVNIISVQILSKQIDQEITASNISTAYSYNKKVKVGASAEGKLTYTSSDTSVAKITPKGVLWIKGPGRTTITITAEETEVYKAATKKIVVTVKPKKNGFTSYTSPKSKTVKLKWKEDTTVTGYVLQMADNSDFSGKKTAKAKSSQTSTTITGLTSGETYYFRIRSYYKLSNGKTLYGAWSKVREVVVK